MTWNFRLVKHTGPKSNQVWYGVHEVFYDESGKPWTMTQEPVHVDGESAKDVVAYLRLIQHDLKRSPVLDTQTLKWAKLPKGIRSGRTKKFKDIKTFMDDLRNR